LRILPELLRDPDAEVRAQTLRALGWLARPLQAPFTELVVRLMKDREPRVRFFAAKIYARTPGESVKAPDITKPVLVEGQEVFKFERLLELLKEADDKDPYLRHAGVVGLVAMAKDAKELWDYWAMRQREYPTPAVRLGVLLALRRLASDKCAEFLANADPRVATEAARAVHDERIAGAMPKLAVLADKSGQPDPIAYRALSACFKVGTPEAAVRVAKFAARQSEPGHTRVFALKLLADWTNPPRRDPVTGLIHDLPKRPENIAAEALRPVLAGVFAGSDTVRSEAVRVVAKLGMKDVGPVLTTLVKDAKAPVSARVEALQAIAAIKDPAAAEITAFALASPDPLMRAAGRAAKARTSPGEVLAELPALLLDEKTSRVERQGAFAILAAAGESETADKTLADWLDFLHTGRVPSELFLDVLDAAETRIATTKLKLHAPLRQKVDAFRAVQAKIDDKLGPWSETLVGGDAAKGRDVFLNNAAVYCQRCHRLDGQGGDVGPQLNGIAAELGKDRRYLLESVVLPNAQIAKGFETVVLNLADGRTVSGVLKSDDKKQVRLMTAEAQELVIAADDIESRRTGPSAMPDDLHKKLTRRELRDLVEFLASLKEPAKKGGH
jgi:quinoprotein glucose dehydrogenase